MERYSNISASRIKSKISAGIPGPAQFFDGLFAHIQSIIKDQAGLLGYRHFRWIERGWHYWVFEFIRHDSGSNPDSEHCLGTVGVSFESWRTVLDYGGGQERPHDEGRLGFVFSSSVQYLSSLSCRDAIRKIANNTHSVLEKKARDPQEEDFLSTHEFFPGYFTLNIPLPYPWDDVFHFRYNIENYVIPRIEESGIQVSGEVYGVEEYPPNIRRTMELDRIDMEEQDKEATWSASLKRGDQQVDVFALVTDPNYLLVTEIHFFLEGDEDLSSDIAKVLTGIEDVPHPYYFVLPLNRLGDLEHS